MSDLKLDNLLVKLEHPGVIKDTVGAQASNPMPRKIIDGRTLYLSNNDFGPLQSLCTYPKIADFDLAQFADLQPKIHPIQTDAYQLGQLLSRALHQSCNTMSVHSYWGGILTLSNRFEWRMWRCPACWMFANLIYDFCCFPR